MDRALQAHTLRSMDGWMLHTGPGRSKAQGIAPSGVNAGGMSHFAGYPTYTAQHESRLNMKQNRKHTPWQLQWQLQTHTHLGNTNAWYSACE